MDEFKIAEPNQEALFEGIMQKVGNNGPFQRRYNYIYNIGLVICASMVYMNLILAMNVPDFWCHVPGRENTNFSEELWKNFTLPRENNNLGVESFSSCRMYANIDTTALIEYVRNTTEYPYVDHRFVYNETTKCLHGYDYDNTYYQQTTVTQQDWVCDKEIYVTNTFVFNRIGEVVGTFFIGQMGDLFGRRFTFYASVFISVIGRLMIVSTSHNFILFSISAVVASLSSISLFQAPLIIAMETSEPDSRGQIAMWQSLGWTMGLCLLPMIFWIVGDWIWFLLISSLPTLIFLGFPYYMIESPRWLANKQKYKECAEMLNRIANINKKEIRYTESSLKQIFGKQKDEKVYGVMSLFSHWRLARNTILLVLGWTISYVTYLTIILNSSRMAGNPFMNFFWQSLIELPAYIIGQYLGDRLGRRITNAASFVGAGLTCIPVIMIINDPALEFMTTCFVVIIKFFVTINFYISMLQAMETYPTCLRQTGMSLGSFSAHILGILGPYIVLLGTNFDARYPYMIFMVLFFIGTLVMMFLPETLHQKLPETLTDAKKFGKSQPFWFLPKRVHQSNEGSSQFDTEIRTKDYDLLETLNQPQYAL